MSTILPPTEKQIRYARVLSSRTGATIPWDVQQGRHSLSRWIEQQQAASKSLKGDPGAPTSKQVGFAERIARVKRLDVPDECYRSRSLLSSWITANKF